jgi:purine catabolism regulator
VTGHLTDWSVLQERAAAFGWDLSVPRAVMVAEIDTLDERRFAQLAGTPAEGWACRRLAETARSVLGREAIVWERSAGVAALARASASGSEALRHMAFELQTAASRRMADCQISVGIGRITADPFELGSSFTEALRALMVGRRAAGPGQVCLFEELGVNRLLLSCPAAELRTFHDAALGRVLAYERAHPGCALLASLEAFLAAQGNIAHAARALFVHYNTVRYRLDRLEQLLGPFVDDAERCLELGLALHVGRILSQDDTYPNSATMATAPASRSMATISIGRSVSLNNRRDTT